MKPKSIDFTKKLDHFKANSNTFTHSYPTILSKYKIHYLQTNRISIEIYIYITLDIYTRKGMRKVENNYFGDEKHILCTQPEILIALNSKKLSLKKEEVTIISK